MRRIEIDEEVFQHFQSKAIPLVETPNDVLRRLLGLEKKKKRKLRESRASAVAGSKRAAVRLGELIDAGLLQQGQVLYLHDYSGNRVAGGEAKAMGDKLYYRGKFASMSALARDLLSKSGYRAKAVRGPSFWCTADGLSVTEIWTQYRAKAKTSKDE